MIEFQDIAIRVDPAVAEEGPVLTDFGHRIQVDLGDQNFFLVV